LPLPQRERGLVVTPPRPAPSSHSNLVLELGPSSREVCALAYLSLVVASAAARTVHTWRERIEIWVSGSGMRTGHEDGSHAVHARRPAAAAQCARARAHAQCASVSADLVFPAAAMMRPGRRARRPREIMNLNFILDYGTSTGCTSSQRRLAMASISHVVACEVELALCHRVLGVGFQEH
jgi:hypothetical protein